MEQARLALAQAEQQNRQLDATLNAASADFSSLQTQAALKLREAERIDALYRRHMVSEQQKDDADSAFRTAQANLLASKARMTQARVNRGLPGDDNLLLRQARNRLAQAELNLAYSRVHASQDGIITNLQLKPGSFAAAGAPLLALVSEQVDVIADFREKSLRHVNQDSQALVAFDGEPGRLYRPGSPAWMPGSAPASSMPTASWPALPSRIAGCATPSVCACTWRWNSCPPICRPVPVPPCAAAQQRPDRTAGPRPDPPAQPAALHLLR